MYTLTTNVCRGITPFTERNPPMHDMTRAAGETGGYFIEDFTYDDRLRVNEARRLTLEQVADDVDSTAGARRDRIGDRGRGGWVGHNQDRDEQHVIDKVELLWQKWTPDQVALEAGMAVYLDRLTDKQREAIRLVYSAGLTMRVAAAYSGVTLSAFQRRLEPAIESLRRMLAEAFIREEEAA
jgi:DNA-directed RNA polymerase specialized sigma24 family protein